MCVLSACATERFPVVGLQLAACVGGTMRPLPGMDGFAVGVGQLPYVDCHTRILLDNVARSSNTSCFCNLTDGETLLREFVKKTKKI